MTATPEEAATQETKTVAAINHIIVELLVSPEYGMDFITELREYHGSTVSDGQVDDRVTAILRDLARPFIEALPEETRENYKKFLPPA